MGAGDFGADQSEHTASSGVREVMGFERDALALLGPRCSDPFEHATPPLRLSFWPSRCSSHHILLSVPPCIPILLLSGPQLSPHTHRGR